MGITRREAIDGLAMLGLATLAVGSAGVASAKDKPPVKASTATATASATASGVAKGKHQVVPLPFDPAKLRGLSERLFVSHHENNYAGAVKNLNQIEEELARVTKDTPGFLVAGLRERELMFTNSLILHERYFGNLGGDGKPAGAVQAAIGTAFGKFGRFEELFCATGMSLTGGSGWAILDFNFHSGDLRLYGSGSHTQSVSSGAPLLVMDMYEHAYQIDYGATASAYIEAFLTNVHWGEVNRRYERALKASRALRA